MKQKKMVYDPKVGRYLETYVDIGKGRALPGHGSTVKRAYLGHSITSRGKGRNDARGA